MSEVETIPEALQQYQEPETPEVAETPEVPDAPDASEKPADPEPEAKVDPVTEKAAKAGWRPKEEYEGDPDTWVDAGEFVRRQPLFEQIKAERKRAKDLEKKIEAVTNYAKKAADTARAQTLKEIEMKRRQAVEDGDVEAFTEADKAYDEAKKEPEIEQPQSDDVPDEVQDFAKRNASWFEQNYVMTEESVKATQFYRNKGLSLKESLEKAEADIKRKFPEHFENSNRKRPQTVAEGTKEARPKTITYNNLTSEQKQVFSAMKGLMSLEEYIGELKKQGEFDA